MKTVLLGNSIDGRSILLPLLIMIINCGSTVDTNQDFAMTLNERVYQVKLGEPVARIQELESGYTYDHRYTLTFPVRHFNPLKNRGFELTFDPSQIKIGKVIKSKSGDDQYTLRFRYYPLTGHKLNQGILLAFSSGYGEGELQVRFDLCEPKIGGRVKGSVTHATLYGFFESSETGEIKKPKDPKKLEIFNFTFDSVFQAAVY